MNPSQLVEAQQLKLNGLNSTQIADQLNLNKNTVRRNLNEKKFVIDQRIEDLVDLIDRQLWKIDDDYSENPELILAIKERFYRAIEGSLNVNRKVDREFFIVRTTK